MVAHAYSRSAQDPEARDLSCVQPGLYSVVQASLNQSMKPCPQQPNQVEKIHTCKKCTVFFLWQSAQVSVIWLSPMYSFFLLKCYLNETCTGCSIYNRCFPPFSLLLAGMSELIFFSFSPSVPRLHCLKARMSVEFAYWWDPMLLE